MNRVLLIILFLVPFSGFSQEDPGDNNVIMISPKSPYENCDNRVVEVSIPEAPNSLKAQHTLIRQGSCSVNIYFDLSESGEVSKIESEVEEERCEPFQSISENSIKSTVYSEAKFSTSCKKVLTFEIE